jgi:hypothetical protein
MEDAIGQASAMTGGYGNSYAQSVGQQMYQKEMQGLNDIIPDLYQLALDKYNAEGQELLNKYNLLSDDYNRQFTNYWTQKQHDEAINSNSEDSTSDWLTEDTEGTEDTDNSQEESKTPEFEGTTQKGAVDYLQENGVPLADAVEAVMTESAWKSHRNKYLKTGKDITGAGQFSSYEEYLLNITEYLISQYS